MKFLLTLFTILTASNVQATDETDKLVAITPLSYEQPKVKMQNSKASAIVWAGNILNEADVGKKIQESVEPFKKELSEYFPNNELESLLSKQINEVNSNIVKNKMTDAKLIEVYKYFGNNLISNIFEKILQKQGIQDSNRRTIWTKKLLAPFNTCISKSSNGYYAAAHCMDSLTKSLIPTAGLGIVYEMSLSNFNSSIPEKNRTEFNYELVNLYKRCLPNNNIDTNQVLNCSVNSLKHGLLKVADSVLTKTINETASNETNAKNIKSQVTTPFNQCVNNITSTSQDIKGSFFKCLDNLTKFTGIELVKDKILNTQSIKNNFSKPELERLAAEKSDFFQKCADLAITNNIRSNGMLDIQDCQTKITNDVTYKVITKTFIKSAEDNLKNNQDQIKPTIDLAKKSLDSCWRDNLNTKDRDLCIKSSVINLTKQIAGIKLNLAIPEGPQKSETLADGLSFLKQCLNKNLPTNISEAQNTNEKLEECTNKLTKDTALKVAASEVRKTLQNKFSPNEIEEILTNFVTKSFNSCLGNKPTDFTLDKCTDDLKMQMAEKVLNETIQNYLGDRPGINLEKTREDIRHKLISEFKSCLQKPNKELCTDKLFKEANKTIVVSFGRTEAAVQLNATKIPSKLDSVEEDFIECTDTEAIGEKLNSILDNCNKNFALNFAKILGEIKLNYLLEKALGNKVFNEQNQNINKILKVYKTCLSELERFKMSDNLTDKISICTKTLENNALNIVRANLADWMSSEQKDASTLSIKQHFANILPCLSVLLPTDPYSPELKSNTESILKPIAQLISQYIEYNPENAKSNLDEIINELKNNLDDVSKNEKVKTDLINLLYKNGALDQFIKSMVQGKVKEAFKNVSDKDLPLSIRDGLISRKNFDDIFSTNEGKEIKDIVFNNILKPIISGSDFKSPEISTSLENINNKVVKMLIMSPSFGDVIVKSGIQNQIDSMNSFKKFVVKTIYGRNNLKWDLVRTSELGKKAEEYVKVNILTPQFNGKTIPINDQQKISLEAEKLVTEAIKKYEANK